MSLHSTQTSRRRPEMWILFYFILCASLAACMGDEASQARGDSGVKTEDTATGNDAALADTDSQNKDGTDTDSIALDGETRSDLSPETLIGMWECNDSDGHHIVRNFKADGTMDSAGYGDDSDLILWQLAGNLLTLELIENGTVEGISQDELFSSEYEILTETVAIAGDRLIFGVYIRTSGGGSTLDGTWVYKDEGWQGATYGEGVFPYMSDEIFRYTIVGDTYTYISTITGFEIFNDEKNEFFDEREDNGHVTIGEDNVILESAAEPEEVSQFLRVDEHVLVMGFRMMGDEVSYSERTFHRMVLP
jgi:hypothetical protein